MKVFVTGASGFVGSAVVRELIRAGNQVLGLARSEVSAQQLRGMGAEVHRGDMDDLESLKKGAAQAEGVIHTAFNHDFSKFAANCEADRHVIEALGSALVGTNRPLVVTSGTALLSSVNRLATEADTPAHTGNPRIASEEAAQAVKAHGVRVSIVRLPPTVHGEGDHGFVPLLINLAREKGVSAYVGEGLNRWPAVHRLEAAQLYRRILEKAPQGGVFHGTAEEGVCFRDIATAIGKHLNLPVVRKSPEEAAAHFTWFAHFAAVDNPTSSELTRKQVGWWPDGIGLLADLEQGHYFPKT